MANYNPYLSVTEPPLKLSRGDVEHERARILYHATTYRRHKTPASLKRASIERIQDSVFRLDASGHGDRVPEWALDGLGIHRTTTLKPVFTAGEIAAMRAAGVKFYGEPEPR